MLKVGQPRMWAFMVLAAGSVGVLPSAAAAQVEISVKPLKTEWLEGERIKGVITLRNRGTRDVNLESFPLPAPVVLRANGEAAANFWPRPTDGCQGPMEMAPRLKIPVGGQDEQAFEIATDPLGGSYGVRLAPGEYTLSFRSMQADLGVPTPIKPGTITVKANPEFAVGHRIRFMGIGGERIAVVREDGEAQSFALQDGAQLAHTELGDITPTVPCLDEAQFSWDGKVVARIIVAPEDRERFAVQLTRLADGARPAVYTLRRTNNFVVRLRGFDRAGEVLRLGMGDWIDEMRVADGSTTVVGAWRGHAEIAPDGQVAIMQTEGVRDRKGTPVSGPWTHSYVLPLMGVQGAYVLTHEAHEWWSYDGKKRRTFADAGPLAMAESADGALVAWGSFATYDPAGLAGGRIGIYSTDAQAKLWEINDGKQHEVGFAGEPCKLVAATMVSGDYGACWISDRFEVFDARTGARERTLILGRAK